MLLGRYIGFTLDLSGIAGFIVAIGITADSFVVFFERLKDEVREGRNFRSAVPRGWVTWSAAVEAPRLSAVAGRPGSGFCFHPGYIDRA